MDKPWLQVNPYGEYEEDMDDIPKPSEPEEDRPKYRQSRIGRAVKVYSVAQESRYLIIRNIPQLDLIDELLRLLGQFGEIESNRKLVDIKAEPFTDTLWVQFKDIDDARLCKNKVNRFFFYGSHLFVYYDVFSETVEDTKAKLLQRKRAVERRCLNQNQEKETNSAISDVSPSDPIQADVNLQEQDLTPSGSIPSRDVEQTREDNPDPSPPSQEAENEENSECLSKQPLLLHSKRAYTYKRVYPQPKPASEDSNPSDPAKESSIYPLTFSSSTYSLLHQKLHDLDTKQQQTIQESKQTPHSIKPKKRRRI